MRGNKPKLHNGGKNILIPPCSEKHVIKHVLPYIKLIFERNKAHGKKIADELELDSAEILWLEKRN